MELKLQIYVRSTTSSMRYHSATHIIKQNETKQGAPRRSEARTLENHKQDHDRPDHRRSLYRKTTTLYVWLNARVNLIKICFYIWIVILCTKYYTYSRHKYSGTIHVYNRNKIFTVLSTSFRKLVFAWCFTQKKSIFKLLSWFNAKPFDVTTYAQTVLF